MKTCPRCHILKALEDFSKPETNRCCKECRNIESRKYYQENKEKCQLRIKKYALLNKRKTAERAKKYRTLNIEKIKNNGAIYYLKNKERILNNQYVYRKENKDKIRIKDRIRKKKLMKTSLLFNWRVKLSKRIGSILKINNQKKSKATLKLLGCTVSFFKNYIEEKFQPGMTWENYGLKGWHIDHIRPCSSFNLSLPEEQQKCFHYSNLQPLWAKDNLEKGCKYQISENKC